LNIEPWFLRVLVKSAFCGVPAGGLLLWLLQRRGVKSWLFYASSCVNYLCYILWLAIGFLISAMAQYPKLGNSIGPGLFAVWIVLPLASTLIAFVLFFWSFGAQPGERRFIVPANLLMLILWATGIPALN